jgi:hypothetical protein
MGILIFFLFLLIMFKEKYTYVSGQDATWNEIVQLIEEVKGIK